MKTSTITFRFSVKLWASSTPQGRESSKSGSKTIKISMEFRKPTKGKD